jgi:hypothetical protein
LEKWAPRDFDFKEFMKGLVSIQALPICLGCLKGGGNDACKIRPCASKRKISDCSECNELTKCKNSEALQKVRTGALRVGMLIKTDKTGVDLLVGASGQICIPWSNHDHSPGVSHRFGPRHVEPVEAKVDDSGPT